MTDPDEGDVVFFVFATFEHHEEAPAGVWSCKLSEVCSAFKTRGAANTMYRGELGKITAVRVEERIWRPPRDGSPPVIISENIFNQREMRHVSRGA